MRGWLKARTAARRRTSDGPILMSNAPRLLPDGPVAATAVKDIVLAHVFD